VLCDEQWCVIDQGFAALCDSNESALHYAARLGTGSVAKCVVLDRDAVDPIPDAQWDAEQVAQRIALTQGEIEAEAMRVTTAILGAREKYVQAWVAETGLLPSESQLVEDRSDPLRFVVSIRRRQPAAVLPVEGPRAPEKPWGVDDMIEQAVKQVAPIVAREQANVAVDSETLHMPLRTAAPRVDGVTREQVEALPADIGADDTEWLRRDDVLALFAATPETK
jgi:hypothetical protein